MKYKIPKLGETIRKPIKNEESKDVMQIEAELSKLHPDEKIIDKKDSVRTTLYIPKSLQKKMKLYCAENDITIKDFIGDLIRQKLK